MIPHAPTLLAFASSALFSGVVALAAPPCALEFEALTRDFGEVSDTLPVQHTFKFRNTSDRTITFVSVRGGYSTTRGPEKRSYAPGETGEITLTFNPKNRKGPQTKTYIVATDDPNCPRQQISVTANVVPIVYIEPSKTFFTEARRGEGATTTVVVTGRGPSFEITGIEVDNPLFKATQVNREATEEDGHTVTRVTLEITLTREAPMGTHNSVFVLTTNDPAAARVDLPVAGAVVGDIRAVPPGMLARTFTPSTPFQAQVRIDSRTDTPFNIKMIDVEGPAAMSLAVDYLPTVEDGKPGYLVTLAGTTAALAGQFRGVITIETDLPGEEPFKLNWISTTRDGPLPRYVP